MLNTRGVSFNQLNTYLNCPKKYQHSYQSGERRGEPVQEALLRGTLFHAMMEVKEIGVEPLAALETYLKTWLEHDALLTKYTDIIAERVISYAEPVSDLLLRCATNYQGDDPIRKADKQIADKPLAYPPKEFSKAYDELKLWEVKSQADSLASQDNPDFLLFSVSNVVAYALFLAKNCTIPPDFKTIAIEHDFEKYDLVPWSKGTHVSGRIDKVYEKPDKTLVIADFKTSESLTKQIYPREVLFHPQLNFYVWAYAEQTGDVADSIAIINPSRDEIVEVPIDIDVVYSVIETYKTIQASADSVKEKPKVPPTLFNSPCMKEDWQTKRVKYLCPYINKCHPMWVEKLYADHVITLSQYNFAKEVS